MKRTKEILPLGIVCLIVAILQIIGIKKISIVMPYLLFCACSIIIFEENRKLPNIFKIISVGFLGLPILDLVISMLTASWVSNMAFSVLITFLQTCIYFVVFVFVNTWISKKKNNFQSKAYVILLFLILIYSLLEGIHTTLLADSVNQAIEQGTVFYWLSAFDNGIIFSIFYKISKIVFCLGVFYTSIQLSAKH